MLFLTHRMLSKVFPNSSIASFSNAEDAFVHIIDTGTDILITDHGMGLMSGADLIRELRPRNIQIPIIMWSGCPTAEEEARLAGATEFLNKHLDLKVLEHHIRTLIHAPHASAPQT